MKRWKLVIWLKEVPDHMVSDLMKRQEFVNATLSFENNNYIVEAADGSLAAFPDWNVLAAHTFED